MSWFEVPLGILVVNSLREGENGRGYVANTISQSNTDFFLDNYNDFSNEWFSHNEFDNEWEGIDCLKLQCNFPI